MRKDFFPNARTKPIKFTKPSFLFFSGLSLLLVLIREAAGLVLGAACGMYALAVISNKASKGQMESCAFLQDPQACCGCCGPVA